MSTNDRVDFIDELYDYLQTINLYKCDTKTTGILWAEPADQFTFEVHGGNYTSVMLNDEITVDQDIEEKIFIDDFEETETDYKCADSTDKKINKTYILVDKQNQQIESVINTVTKQNDKISQVTQTVDTLNSKIENIADITTSGESWKATIDLDNINTSEPIMIKVHPFDFGEISNIYPRDNLYPATDFYLRTRILRFYNKTTNEKFEYEIPYDLYSYDSDNYDEFILDYEEHKAYIIKRVSLDHSGMPVLLDEEQVLEFEYPKIELTDGNYTISLIGYSNAYISVRLMSKNIYTTQFATKVEIASEINQKSDEIMLEVEQKTAGFVASEDVSSALTLTKNQIVSEVASVYETKTNSEKNYSRLTQQANNITSEVSKKVGENEIISKINQSAEEISINADKISLNGKTLNLADNIAIKSNNFNVDANGNMTCANAQFNGGNIALKGGTSENPNFLISSYDDADAQKARITPNFFSIGSGSKYISMSVDGIPMIHVVGDNTSFALHDNLNRARMSVGDFYIDGGYMHAKGYNYDSLESLKENIKQYDKNVLELIKEYNVYKYNFKNEKEQHIGFVIPDKGGNYKVPQEVLTSEKDGIDVYSMCSVLWKAVQEQQEQIEKLQTKIKEMRRE